MIATMVMVVTLFMDAMGKSQLTRFEFTLIIGAVDVTVHVITLYLQYSFATKYYNKYCKCLELFMSRIFMSRMKVAMHKAKKERLFDESKEMNQLTSIAESDGETEITL